MTSPRDAGVRKVVHLPHLRASRPNSPVGRVARVRRRRVHRAAAAPRVADRITRLASQANALVRLGLRVRTRPHILAQKPQQIARATPTQPAPEDPAEDG
eukprot:2480022-Alexandrium_andersonii.AAC.1